MTMQTDVKAGHLNNSGFVVLGRTRLKAISTVGSATTVNATPGLDTGSHPEPAALTLQRY